MGEQAGLVLLTLCACLLVGCEDPRVRELAAHGEHARASAPQSEGDSPLGYPTGFPLVPGARVVEGALDEGVIRTSVLEYEGECAMLESRLLELLEQAGARVLARNVTPDERVSLRVALGGREASFSMHRSLGICLMRTIASDATPIVHPDHQ